MKFPRIFLVLLILIALQACRQQGKPSENLAGKWLCVDMFVNVDTTFSYDVDWDALYNVSTQTAIELSEDSSFLMTMPFRGEITRFTGNWYHNQNIGALAFRVQSANGTDSAFTRTYAVIRTLPDTLWLMSMLGDTIEQIEVFARNH